MSKQFLDMSLGSLLKARRICAAVLFALCSMLLAPCSAVEAQQSKKVPLVGVFVVPPPSAVAPRLEAFRQRLRELGYVEGKSMIIESRSAEGKLERVPALAAELVRLKVDVIVSGGAATTRPAKEATKTIPIVMARMTILLGTGLSLPSRVLAGTLPGYPRLPRRSVGSAWNS